MFELYPDFKLKDNYFPVRKRIKVAVMKKQNPVTRNFTTKVMSSFPEN